jgi:hypothetical protein
MFGGFFLAKDVESMYPFYLVVLHKQFWIGKSWKKVGWKNLKT